MTFTFHGDELDSIPADWPKKMPPATRQLAEAEWTQSMMSTRMDEYRGWASKKLGRVFVWRRDADVAEFAPVRFRPYASGPFNGDEKDSFTRCLRFGWERERDGYDLGQPGRIKPGFIDQAALEKLVRYVWRPAWPASERRLFLDFYDAEGGLSTKWCWKDEDTDEASQEFDSEEAALEAMRNERLEWSRLEDLGN